MKYLNLKSVNDGIRGHEIFFKFRYYIKWPDCKISGRVLYVYARHVVLENPLCHMKQYIVTKETKTAHLSLGL